MTSIVYLIDCMNFMKDIPDNYFELAICDPEYGINITAECMGGRKTIKPDKNKTWDSNPPEKKYFDELFRISKNQIIWGGNYFNLWPNRYYIIWDKGETMYGRDFAECEMAWTNINRTRIFKLSPNQLQRIHPTQKPVALYKWLLKNYAKEDDKIFDSHVGSGSLRMACHELGFDFEGCEIDKEYWEAQELRYKEWKKKYHNEFYIPDEEMTLFKQEEL